MNLKTPLSAWLPAVLAGVLVLAWAPCGRAQTPLNVTNYGAIGDLLTLNGIVVTSNSTAAFCPNAKFAATDVGKLIEIFNAGIYRGASNETLFARITAVSSQNNITLSAPAGATATNLAGLYGTDCYPAFTSAIANCTHALDTIIIPAGNYFLIPPNALARNGHDDSIGGTLKLQRGGITFVGEGTAILTGMGGWVNYKNQGQRSSLFVMQVPMSNNQPLVFTNLIFDGGCSVGNIHNLGWPASGSTGEGWDGTHHWMVTVAGTGAMIDSLMMQNCTVQHWRGEMMEDTSGSPNLFLTATNCLFYDGDGSCINNFAHRLTFCTFSNAMEVEEFYRTYNTNVSYMVNCLCTGLRGIALNGGYYGNPAYNIVGNTFTNGDFALLTTPATTVYFYSNSVYNSQGIALGVAGYQGSTINSNIVIAWNNFNGVQYALSIFGNGNNSSSDIYFCSNQVNNAWGIANGYGWSTNVFVFNNTGNSGRFDEGSLQGQYFLDASNQYTGEGLGDSFTAVNIFTYGHGALGRMQNGIATAKYGLDDSQPAKTPAGATMTINNISANTYPLYLNAKLTGTPVTVTPGQSATFYWNNNAWNPSQSANGPPPTPDPPTNLHPLN